MRGIVLTEEEQDYVPTAEELLQLQIQMEKDFNKMKTERLDNENIVPFDEKKHNIKTAKEQVLDLNDKFDFLVKIMMQSHTIKH
jgi:hypothetical protein